MTRPSAAVYGTRAAAASWAEHYTSVLEANVFVRGMSNPCLFHHRSRNILTMVHGDDFLSTASGVNLKWLDVVLRTKLEVKTELLGPKNEEIAKQQIMFLDRVVSWEEGGLRYEPDPRHAEIIIAQLGLQDAKPVSTPGVSATSARSEEDQENPPLTGAEASSYRGLAARTNFLAQDRTDIQYASKEISLWMAVPRSSDWEGLKRMGRYLLGKPRATMWYAWQSMPGQLVAFSDTDWAGDKGTRKSTSGGAILHGSHLIRSWSRILNLVALSSAEAELYGTVRASCELLGTRSLARDYGQEPSMRIFADASAALGIIHRQGLGKLRHIDTNSLWLQQAARKQIIGYDKILGTVKPADMLTDQLPAEPRERHSARNRN